MRRKVVLHIAEKISWGNQLEEYVENLYNMYFKKQCG